MSESESGRSIRDRCGSWEVHFSRIKDNAHLSADEKGRILDGQARLRTIFDDAWLRKNASVGFLHPVLSQMANEASWSQLELADLGRSISQIEGARGFDTVRGRLREAMEYPGARAEVSVAGKLGAAGYADIDLSPQVMIRSKARAPDIRARFNGQPIFFEITSLHDSADAARASHTFHELTWPLDPEMICLCQVHKTLAQPRIDELKARIQEALAEAKQTRQYKHIGEPGVVDFLAVHPAIQDKRKALARKFKMKAELSGPPIPRDDVKQVKRAIREKSRQLPPDEPGIVVIFANLMFFGSPDPSYQNVVQELEDEVYDIPNLVASAVIDESGIFAESSIFEKPHYVLRRNAVEGMVRETILVIKNRYSKLISNAAIAVAVDNLPAALSRV